MMMKYHNHGLLGIVEAIALLLTACVRAPSRLDFRWLQPAWTEFERGSRERWLWCLLLRPIRLTAIHGL
jgi:hypothetical protein